MTNLEGAACLCVHWHHASVQTVTSYVVMECIMQWKFYNDIMLVRIDRINTKKFPMCLAVN